MREFASGPSSTPKHSIYISQSTDPYFNLSIEDWLFRHKSPDAPLLLLYRNDPCVVIGRNQNPWKEVNLRASRRTGIPFIRRHSGGGTVYHDLGNTNFSIHLPRASFDRRATGQVVLEAVRSLGIDATLNDRNDVCVKGEKICAACRPSYLSSLPKYDGKHVSGSAYKIVKDRAYHHGTMLISTRLDTLGELLHSGMDAMETRGVASVRSPVCNLQQHLAKIDHRKFVQAMVTTFRQQYGIDEEVFYVGDSDDTQNVEHVKRGMEELKTWDWAFGQTPEFIYRMQRIFAWGTVYAELRSNHGKIISCILTCPEIEAFNEGLTRFGGSMQGQQYGFLNHNLVSQVTDDERLVEVWRWLKSEINT